jgi:hypothetical protein
MFPQNNLIPAAEDFHLIHLKAEFFGQPYGLTVA